jgi:hypothetical protein
MSWCRQTWSCCECPPPASLASLPRWHCARLVGAVCLRRVPRVRYPNLSVVSCLLLVTVCLSIPQSDPGKWGPCCESDHHHSAAAPAMAASFGPGFHRARHHGRKQRTSQLLLSHDPVFVIVCLRKPQCDSPLVTFMSPGCVSCCVSCIFLCCVCMCVHAARPCCWAAGLVVLRRVCWPRRGGPRMPHRDHVRAPSPAPLLLLRGGRGAGICGQRAGAHGPARQPVPQLHARL